MKKLFVIIIMIFVTIGPAWARASCFQGIEYLSGFAQAELDGRDDYQFIPLVLSLDFNIKPLTKQFGFNPPGMIQLQIEPFLNIVTSPDKNIEVGTSFLFKFGLTPETWKLQPYIKTGAGTVYITQHTKEQSTQFNFITHFGAGLHYILNKHQALTLE